MFEWKMNTDQYLDEILSVSVIPSFFEKVMPKNGEKTIGFMACGPAMEIRTIDKTMPGYFSDKQTYLTDFSSNFIGEALNNIDGIEGAFYFKKADMTNTGMPDDFFDLIMCINGLIFEDLIPGALEEAGRLLKEGGLYIANTYPPYEQMSGSDFTKLPEFRDFERKNQLKYLPTIGENDNAYFEIYNEANKQKQVLISDNNMEKLIIESPLNVQSVQKYELPKDLVAKVRNFPLDEIKKGYSYETTVWTLRM
ncbi:MAG: class I SAM-dependent methyltransferase [Candidatus Woesearchaeota archaeon]